MAAHVQPGRSDEWYTPKYIFDALECTFYLDVAAAVETKFTHVPAVYHINKYSIVTDWYRFVWCNPPWSGRGKKDFWIDKMIKHNNGILLAPDRSSAEWWQKAAVSCISLLQVKGKIKFIRPDGSTGDQPSTGTTLFAFGLQAHQALINAERNGLGILLTPLTNQQ